MNKDILIYIDTINDEKNRHIWIGWINYYHENKIHVDIECIHLIKEENIYKFDNSIITISTISENHKNIILLKNSTEEIKIKIKDIALKIDIPDNCQEWMEKLLNNMVKEEIITYNKVKKIRSILNF